MVKFPPSLADFTLNIEESYDCVTREFEQATSSTQRGHILEIYVMSMRLVLNGVHADQKEELNEAFRQSYNLLLIREGRKGDLLDPMLMEMITAREVLAGRMDANDGLRTLSVSTCDEIRSQQGSSKESFQPSQTPSQTTVRKSWLPWRR